MSTAFVLTSDGEPLAEVSLQLPANEASAGVVLQAQRPQRLVQYYFARGGRQVVLQRSRSSRWQGRIVATRWQPGGRLWYLEAD